MINKIKNRIRSFFEITKLKKENEEIKLILGKILININLEKNPTDISEIEFKIFSQFGDDGIIQFILSKLDLEDKYKNFIEFGVENYEESNTRFLLFNNNWSGLVIDSSQKNIDKIKNSNFFWKFDLDAICSFITRDNINTLIANSKINKNIGLLSIDIDGNDYWVWEKIEEIDPHLVIIEYNSNFGFKNKITVPYEENFIRNKAHFSNLYWGASLEALKFLGEKKNYKFICTNSAGNNAYFIKSSEYNKLGLKLEKNFYSNKFRESRDKNGKKNYLSGENKLKMINDLYVIDVEKNKKVKLKEIL